MTRQYFLKLFVIAVISATNVIGETYRDAECPECEYGDVKHIQISTHSGHSGTVKQPKSPKSKSKKQSQTQTDTLPALGLDSFTVDDDTELWEKYVSTLKKKRDKGAKMPKEDPKSSAQDNSDLIAFDSAENLAEEDSRSWNVQVSGTSSNGGNSGVKNSKKTKAPKTVNPKVPTNPPTAVPDENVGDENPNNNAEETEVSVFLPEFQLTFSLADGDALRNLREASTEHNRYLQSLLDIEIYNITYTFLLESVTDPVPSGLHLRQSEATIGDESSSTIISTFQGMLYSSIPQTELQSFLTNLFEENKPLYLSRVRDSSSAALQRTEDVTLSFTGKMSTSSGVDQDSWYQPNGVTDESSEENPVTNKGSPEAESNNSQNQDGDLNVSIVKSSDKTAIIAGALAGSASLLLFAYAYRRRNKSESSYMVTEFYGEDHDNDLESRASQDEYQMSMVAPANPWSRTRLSDIAIAGPKRNGFSYLEAVVNSSYSSGSSMSKLASGATQEEFARSGMKVDIYGNRKEHKKASKRRVKKVSMLMGTSKPRSNNLTTDLEPIEEVSSAVSGSSAKTPESWQSGNEDINNAPPLLPAMSVSSVPSDETPSNDLSNPNNNEKLLEMLSTSVNPDISYNTPLAVPPYDSMDMEGMMENRTNSPIGGEQVSEETPLHMRCLSFGSASDISDFSSPEKSDEPYLKHISEIIHPVYSDSSSDGCAKDMLASINDCFSEDSKVQKLSIDENCVDGNSPVLQRSEIETTSDAVDTESLCYSPLSHEEDEGKCAVPDLNYSDTSGDVSVLQIARNDENNMNI